MEIAIKKQIVHSLWISMTLALGRVLHHPATLTRIGNKFESSAHLRLLTLHMMIALPTQIGNSSVIHTNSVKGIIWQKGNEKKGLQQFLWRLQDPFLACCSNRDISFSRLRLLTTGTQTISLQQTNIHDDVDHLVDQWRMHETNIAYPCLPFWQLKMSHIPSETSPSMLSNHLCLKNTCT